MTLEEAAELVLSGKGRTTCLNCNGECGWVSDRGDINQCGDCWGYGYLVTDGLIQARQLLGLEPDPGRSFYEMMLPEWSNDP